MMENKLFSLNLGQQATSGYSRFYSVTPGLEVSRSMLPREKETTNFSLVFSQIILLSNEINQLKSQIQSPSKVLFVKNLPLQKIKLKEPLSLLFEKEGDNYVVSNLDLDLYGTGETEFDAIKDFTETLEELYFDLVNEKPENLGTYPKFLLEYFKDIT